MSSSVPSETTTGDRARLLARDAEERGQGICRTCALPIWNEGGTIGHEARADGWSDRIERGGDSLVCFKAIDYRHVPLTGREAAIWDRAVAAAVARAVRAEDALRELVRLKDVKNRREEVAIAIQRAGYLDEEPQAADRTAWRALHADYEANQPLAWIAARAVVGGGSPTEHEGD